MACWLQGLVPREGNKGWAKHPPGPSLSSSRTNLLSRGRKRALAHSITRTRGFAVGSGPDPPCRCRGLSTGAKDRTGKSSFVFDRWLLMQVLAWKNINTCSLEGFADNLSVWAAHVLGARS